MSRPLMPIQSHERNGVNSGLLREIRLRDGAAIVVGTIIGSGIFLVPSSVARQISSLGGVLFVWVLGGLLSLAGALALGELGALFPGGGGLYVYLRHVYGRVFGFLYGWGLLTLIHSGSIATLAVAFGLYSAELFSLTAVEQKIISICCILLLTGVNCFGVRAGKFTQNAFTLSKLSGIAILFFLLVRYGDAQSVKMNFWPTTPVHSAWIALGVALIAVLWSYEGWHVVSFTAGEFLQPAKDLPRSLFLGTLIVGVVYVLVNVSYYLALSREAIAASDRVAASALSHVAGPASTAFVSALILVSIFGATNGMVLTGPRVYYAMAKDGLFFSAFGKMSGRYHTPVLALLIQGIWASVLTLLGTFQELFTYVIFTAWVFYGLTVAGVVVLRRRQPHLHRPFRVPAYPWLPVLFVVVACGITLSAVVSNPTHAMIGIGCILAGLPLYLLFRRTDVNKNSIAEGSASST